MVLHWQALPEWPHIQAKVSNRECRHCVDMKRAIARKVNPEKIRAKDRSKWHRNRDRKIFLLRENRKKHVEKRRAYDRKRLRECPKRRAAQHAHAHLWWRLNRGKKNFFVARRRWWIKQATPPWLTKEQRRAIRQFYMDAAARGFGWQVDHIWPLRAKNSSGLNVPWNLQIITAAENIKKWNRTPDELEALQ